ncbi:MAG: hypothetical protein JWM87_757 [Candidatus Eremiobacteraeota bacterium]|nr:hypothetical protein [Candidatus Eremiobacteraeota bacterium]
MTWVVVEMTPDYDADVERVHGPFESQEAAETWVAKQPPFFADVTFEQCTRVEELVTPR